MHTGEEYSDHLADQTTDFEKNIDWRDQGAVSDVKDQGI